MRKKLNLGSDMARRLGVGQNALKPQMQIASANRMTQVAPAGSVHRPFWHAGSHYDQPNPLIASAIMSSSRASGRRGNTECEMSALFETDSGSAKRKQTGSRFSLNLTPMEFAKYNAFYENPVYGLNIGLLAIFISEVFPLKSTYGHVVQQPVNTGVILERGRFKAELEQDLDSSIPRSVVEELIDDLYELMVEFFISAFAGIYDLRAAGINIQIYEAETGNFHRGLRTISGHTRPGPEMIENLQAERVF